MDNEAENTFIVAPAVTRMPYPNKSITHNDRALVQDALNSGEVPVKGHMAAAHVSKSGETHYRPKVDQETRSIQVLIAYEIDIHGENTNSDLVQRHMRHLAPEDDLDKQIRHHQEYLAHLLEVKKKLDGSDSSETLDEIWKGSDNTD